MSTAPSFLILEARFLAGTYGGTEWPPAPFRLLQAIVAGNRGITAPGLAWMERQEPPFILAVDEPAAVGFKRSIPNNSNPRDAKAAMSLRRITHRRVADPVRYCYPLRSAADREQAQALATAALQVHTLGTGEDMCTVHALVVDAAPESLGPVHLWVPQRAGAGRLRGNADALLQVPVPGSLQSLEKRFQNFQRRLDASQHGYAQPVAAPALHDTVLYRSSAQAARHALVALRLVAPGSDRMVSHLHAEDAVVVGGLLRHAAMTLAGQDDAELQDYAAGYGPDADRGRRLSWVPVPSIGHEHADGLIRRGLWLARAADAAWLARLAEHLPAEGLPLIDEHSGECIALAQPVDARDEPVIAGLLRPARDWVSVTPVILPGDYGGGDLRVMTRLLHKAVRESGLDPGLVEHVEFSKQGYLRQAARLREVKLKQWNAEHLILYHVRLRLREPIRGPLVLGRGRHFGLGLMCANPQ